METLNRAVVIKDIADRLNVGIHQIMAHRSVMGIVMDEEAYRDFEKNNPIGMLLQEGERPQGFQVSAVQRYQLVLTFGNQSTASEALRVAEMAQLNASSPR